jgi:hypothetical protein
VHPREAFTGLPQNRKAVLDAQGRARKSLREIFPFQPFHREKWRTATRLTVSTVVHDAGVSELSQNPGLSFEALQIEVGGSEHDFDRHGRPVRPVDGSIHRSHPTRAGEPDDREALVEYVSWTKSMLGVHVGQHG